MIVEEDLKTRWRRSVTVNEMYAHVEYCHKEIIKAKENNENLMCCGNCKHEYGNTYCFMHDKNIDSCDVCLHYVYDGIPIQQRIANYEGV